MKVILIAIATSTTFYDALPPESVGILRFDKKIGRVGNRWVTSWDIRGLDFGVGELMMSGFFADED